MNVRLAFLAAWMLASSALAQVPHPYRIEGRVLVPARLPAGEPIEIVARRGEPSLRLFGGVLGEARVGAGGEFELTLDLDQPGFYLVLESRWLDLRPLWIEVQPGENSIEVLLAPALQAILHGRFTGADEVSPLAGSWVWVEGSEEHAATLDANGDFELCAPAACLCGPLSACPHEYAPLSFDVPGVQDGRTFEVALPLVEPASLRGRVVDSEQRGIPGLTLSFWRGMNAERPLLSDPWGEIRTVTSDAQGEFAADGLPPGDLCLRIEAPRWRGQWLRVTGLLPGEQRNDLELVLLRAASLRGVLLDEFGWPVPLARVIAGGREGSGGPMVTTTDAEGRYAFDAALPGEYVLSASSEGRAARAPRVLTLDEGEREEADLVLGRASAVRILVGDHGAPARVSVLDAPGFLHADQRVWQGELDLVLPPGLYRVVVQNREGLRFERRLLLSGRERAPVILRM